MRIPQSLPPSVTDTERARNVRQPLLRCQPRLSLRRACALQHVAPRRNAPPFSKREWPREGAGLELDLSASRHADRLPVGLRPGLPARGFVNYLEADFPWLLGEIRQAREHDGVRVVVAGPNAFVYFLDTEEPVPIEAIDRRTGTSVWEHLWEPIGKLIQGIRSLGTDAWGRPIPSRFPPMRR